MSVGRHSTLSRSAAAGRGGEGGGRYERSKPEGLLVMSRGFGSDFSQLSSRSEQSAVLNKN